MPDKEPMLKFDFENYVATLMEAMEMNLAPIEVQQDVTLQLGRQLGYRLMNTLTLNFGDGDWAKLTESTGLEPMEILLEGAIERNPAVKSAILEELDGFYSETLEAYNTFKQSHT